MPESNARQIGQGIQCGTGRTLPPSPLLTSIEASARLLDATEQLV